MPMTAADIKVVVAAEVSDAIRNLNQVNTAVESGGKKASAASTVASLAGAGIFAGFGLAARGAMGYETAMNSVQASIGATEAQMKPLGALALKIGSDTQFGATQGAQAIEELGKAGVSIPDILGGAAMSAAQLASATGTDIPMAANVMANAMNTFGISGENATRVADVMTAALNASSLNMNDFANGMASAGSSAAALGIPIEDTAAALAIFSNRGMSGADAGTALRSMFTHLAGPTDEARALMSDLGIAAFDAQGNFIGLEALAGQLQTQMAGLSDEQRLAALTTIFGADAQRVANILFEEGAAGVGKMTDELQANGQAQKASEIRMQGLGGALEQLKGSVETAFISFGTIFLPVLTKAALFAAKLVNGLTKLSKPIKTIILGVGALVGAIALFTGGLGPLLALAGPLAPLLTGVAAAIGAMLLPFILITAAVIGLYLAFKNNFLGIQDIAKRVGEAIGGFVDTASRIVDVMRLAFAEGYPVSQLLYLFPAPLRDVAEKFLLVADAIGDLVSRWQSGGFGAMLDILPDKLKIIGTALLDLAGMGLRALWDAFTNVPWAEIGSTILSGILSGIQQYWPTVAGWLGTLGTLALDLFIDAVQWLAPAGINLMAGLLAGLVEYWPTIKTWLGTIGSLALAGFVAAVQWLVPAGIDLMAGLLAGLVEYWPTIKSWLGTLGTLAIEAMVNIAQWLVPAGISLLAGLLQGIVSYLPTVLLFLGSLYLIYLGALKDIITWLVPAGIDLLAGLLSGIVQYLPTVLLFLGKLYLLYLGALKDIGTWLVQKGIDLMVGLFTGMIEYWPSIVAWMGTVGTLAFGAVGDLIGYLKARGIQLLAGLLQGAVEKWVDVKAWLGKIGNLASEGVGSLLEYLTGRGRQLLHGLEVAAGNKWDDIVSWLGKIGGFASSAVGNLGGVLWQAGWDLLEGFGLGVLAGWEWVKGLLSGMDPRQYKGPPERDRRMLIESGHLVMAGFGQGLQEGWQDVQRLLTGMSPVIGGSVNAQANAATGAGAAAAASQGSSIIYYDQRSFTVDVDSLEDVASAVSVINDLQRDAELVYGAV
jgi:TP901 family phage tail tape measure protein